MKKYMIIFVIAVCLLRTNAHAQVSGSLGNRMLIKAGLTSELVGFFIEPNTNVNSFMLEYSYILNRMNMVSVKVDFNGTMGARYDYMSEPYEDESFPYYTVGTPYGEEVVYFPVRSTLLSFDYKSYNDWGIAPVGSYFTFSAGMVIASHEFDMDEFRDYLKPEVNSGANVDDAVIGIKNRYASPFIGFGVGEDFPIIDNLFLSISADFRFFFLRNSMPYRLLFDNLWTSSYGMKERLTSENMLAYQVLFRPILHNSYTFSVGLSYAF